MSGSMVALACAATAAYSAAEGGEGKLEGEVDLDLRSSSSAVDIFAAISKHDSNNRNREGGESRIRQPCQISVRISITGILAGYELLNSSA